MRLSLETLELLADIERESDLANGAFFAGRLARFTALRLAGMAPQIWALDGYVYLKTGRGYV